MDTYVLSRLTHGLEAIVLHPKELGLLCAYYKEIYLQYKNAYCPVAFQFVIKSEEELKDNSDFLYMGLHLLIQK